MNVIMAWNGPSNADERAVLVRRELPLIQQLSAGGVRVTVVLFGDAAETRKEFEAAQIPVEVLPTPLPPSAAALRSLPAAVLRFRSVLRRVDPDIVEGTEPMPAIAVGLAARWLGRRGVVLYRRQHPRGGRLRLRPASWLAAGLAERTVVMIEATRLAAMADDGTPRERVDVALSGADRPRQVSADETAAMRRSLGIAADARVIAVVSRFRREKGLDVLLSALHLLRDLGNVHVVMAGSGPEEASLRALAAQAPLPVHFVGHRADVAPWYALADVVTMPSRLESFGRTTSETMAAGRPLVATRVGGLVDAVIDGETGFLVPPDDPVALAAALRRVLTDDALAARMRAAARERYENRYTIAHMADARRQVWERAMAGLDAP